MEADCRRSTVFLSKLMYQGDVLKEAVLDGKPLELFDICDTDGNPIGGDDGRSLWRIRRYSTAGRLIRGSCGSRRMTALSAAARSGVFARFISGLL